MFNLRSASQTYQSLSTQYLKFQGKLEFVGRLLVESSYDYILEPPT